MVIDERVNSRVGEGNYGTVFSLGGTVIKVFKRYPQFPPRQTAVGRRFVFEAQCKAYEIAAADPLLSLHVPRFFGSQVVSELIGIDGASVSDDYFLDCAYIIDRVDGSQAEWASVRWTEGLEHLQIVSQRFAELGIEASDGSVFNADDPQHFKVIDFEMRDYVMERVL